MKKSIRYILLTITIISFIPIYMNGFAGYQLNKWLIALSYTVLVGNIFVIGYFVSNRKSINSLQSQFLILIPYLL